MNYWAWGALLIAVAITVMVFLAFMQPKALVVGSSAGVLLLVFGTLMLTGSWPTTPER